MAGRDLLKLLKANGWQFDRVRGSHHILVRGSATISLPVHGSRHVPKEGLCRQSSRRLGFDDLLSGGY